MEHPEITRTLRMGFPKNNAYKPCGLDSLGHEIYPGDELLELDGFVYAKEELFGQSIKILKNHGATYKVAK